MTPGAGTAALEVRDLTFTYSGAGAPALDSVELEVEAGELVVLAGPSASGKSTLLRLACGLVPHFHGGTVAGSARVAGLDILESGPGELAAWVGFVSQEPESQVVSTTVEAEIGLGLDLRGIGGPDRARAVEEVALALAIPHLLERTVDELSGGELQRVALAAALATGPSVVLLDEPTSQLDPVAGDELIWLLRRLNAEWGITVVLAEHRLERCLAAADRVVAMEAGRIGFDGEPERFLAWAERSAAGLATPISRMLSLAGLQGRPAGVRQARRLLASAGVLSPGGEGGASASPSAGTGAPASPAPAGGGRRRWRRDGRSEVALAAEGLWVELDADPEPVEVLRGVEAALRPGERVALMGRNGAGKSTLLRAAAGLLEPAAGRVEAPGGMALLTQAPGDYLVRERVADELPGPEGAELLARLGLHGLGDSDPRDLSGGERQRLALAIALAGRLGDGEQVGAVALDEPTRGLDRDLKEDLAELCRELAGRGLAVVVATHDVEFAAGFADRVLLMGKGHLVADGPAAEVLSGGWYFSTEVARVLGLPGVTTPEQGARAIGGLLRDATEAGT